MRQAKSAFRRPKEGLWGAHGRLYHSTVASVRKEKFACQYVITRIARPLRRPEIRPVEVTTEELKKALTDAGLDAAGSDVIFPFGFKIVNFEGKKALKPLTPEEYKRAIKEETGKVLSDDELEGGSCFFANGFCYSQGCRGRCILQAAGGSWFCSCIY